MLDLRNYSEEAFTFGGTPDRPRLVFEVNTGTMVSRQTTMPWTRTRTYALAAGDRIQLHTSVGGAAGRMRIGVRSQEFGYTVWTDWFVR